MADRYKVTVEEDDGNGWIFGIIAVGVVIFIVITILKYIGIPLLIGFIIYLIVRYKKKQKVLLPTKCTQCNKKNALEYWKTEVIKETPVAKTIYSKNRNGAKESVVITEYTHRKYDKCKFCGAINFTDTIKNTR